MNNQLNPKIDSFYQIDNNLLSYPISLIYMNIRSLRKNFTLLLAGIHKIINKIHLIILVETNITDNENRFFQINGYRSIFLNREGRGGGIAVYIRDDIYHNTTPLNTVSFETIQVDINIKNKIITLFPIYRPPSQNVTTFVTELDTIINNVHEKQQLIIVGDMNVDILKENITTTKYLDMLMSNGLHCLVNETTREDDNNNTQTCIDHLFVRNRVSQTQPHAAVVATTISDHYSLFACMEVEVNAKEKNKQSVQGSENVNTTLQGREISSFKVNTHIRETEWNTMARQGEGTDDIFNNIVKRFDDIYDKSKSVKKVKRKKVSNPWMSVYLVKCCEIRDKLRKKWQKNKCIKKNENEFKYFSNNLNKKLIYAKNSYRKNKFIQFRNNIRATWQLINEILGKTSNSVDETIKINFKNQNVENVCENFAKQFKDNVKNIIHMCDIITLKHERNTVSNTIYMSVTDEEEIFNIIKQLNVQKGAGIDHIRAKDVKNNAQYLTPIITQLVNSSLTDAVVPNLLKTSLIRPIYKSGCKSEYNNYRPISILPVLEKVLEEVISRRLNSFLIKYKVINENQFGFQKNKNINQLLGKFSNYVNKCLSNNMHCLALFIDFSKAFDTLSHKKLIEILERNGIRGHCLNWIKNYLTCRKYRVKIENNLSQEINIDHGVPQGSKLGPTLYLIYANEMLSVLRNSTAFAYADDTAVLVSSRDLNSAVTYMQQELNVITKWCHDNCLVINATKTKIIHFKPPHFKHNDIKIKFHDYECIHNARTHNEMNNDSCSTFIELVNTYKYLGVNLDHNFKWKIHIQDLHKKLRKTAFALYHLGNCSTFEVLKQAYLSLAESYLRHGITAWGSATHCRLLQQSQNRLLKILWKNKQNSANNNSIIHTNSNLRTNQHNERTIVNANNLPKQLQILNIKNLYYSTLASEFLEDNTYLQKIDHTHYTRMRAEGRYKVPQYKNNYGRNTLEVNMPIIANMMPISILNIRNKCIRKKHIKMYLLELQ